MENKLKPCPFCGTAVDIYYNEHKEAYFVLCLSCGAKSDNCMFEETAIRKWNTCTNKIAVGNGKDYMGVNE